MWRLIPHTADLRAELVAPSLGALYQEGASLVRELLVGRSPVLPRERRTLALEGTQLGERFFRYLRELLYLFDAHNFLVAGVAFAEPSCEVFGERFDPERHWVERQLKAVTRHGYRFELQPGGGYRVEAIFDL